MDVCNACNQLPQQINLPMELWTFEIFPRVRNAMVLMLVCHDWYEWITEFYPNRQKFSCKKYTKHIIQENSLTLLRWTNPPKEYYVCIYAVKYNKLNILKYAHESGYPWGVRVCAYAAGNGSLDILQYAHENGCNWNEVVCIYAARNGHLDALKYAHKSGCPWAVRTSICAAQNGHLHILQYAHEQGWLWDRSVCLVVAKNDEIRDWIKSH